MRWAHHALPFLLMLASHVSPRGEQVRRDVPVHVRRLSDRAIVVTLGDHARANQTVALA